MKVKSEIKTHCVAKTACASMQSGQSHCYSQTSSYLGDNCIQNFHLGRYIVGYTVRNLVLWRSRSGAVKHAFGTYIQRYTSPNENFEYVYPQSNTLMQFELKSERCKPHNATRHPTTCDVINDIKLFLTVYYRNYCRKFWAFSNQTSRYKLMCIRIMHNSTLSYFSSHSYVVGTRKNRRNETVLLSTQNMFKLMNKQINHILMYNFFLISTYDLL